MTEALRPRLRGLYAITPDGLTDEKSQLVRVEAALRGGATLLQYRDKKAPADRRAATARALHGLCRRYGARLLINDDLILALAIEADGVHLGVTDGNLLAARQALPPGCLVGVSCYADFARARAAAAAGADYVAFGAVYPSLTKPLAPPAPLSLFSLCRAELGVPSCAIGGITADNAAPLLAAGADLLAVISDLFDAPDVAARAAAYQLRFKEENRDVP
ncbi:MAG: thiamine phosphate synthase [Candidatus Accumulibacter sp.]|uniref:thiamine phosphate synthase n=1 Tax=Accumulibacter sp. TaxID=2053492 RepID=UPI001A367921|nr:thiamine phosphate synthase [Accumulibacter sp.]MBL8395078.1 thiamine phosphate synthase [Accumulibacter sp.]